MLSTIIISAVLVIMVFFAVRHLVKNVKAGRCVGCSGCKSYGKENECSTCDVYKKDNVDSSCNES